jgi:type III secretion protein Q
VGQCLLAPPLNISPAIHISILFGATTLSLRDLRGLETGDTVLIDDRFSPDRPLRAVAGKTLVAEARFAGSHIEAMSGFSPVRGGSAFRWMIEPLEGVQLDMNDTNQIATNQLGDMKVKLVFEVGRAELSVDEIEKLGPGHVFQVSRATDGHVDVIAGGRVIGSGELVKIGDDIGVRLKRVAS